MKPVPLKRAKKSDRERRVLMGLVELYIESGKPIGSNTLMEAGYGDLSSATIRNYFASLEKDGYLQQPHASGGRVPTGKAYELYAQENFQAEGRVDEIDRLKTETKEIAAYLHQGAELLAEMTGYPIFLSLPRFDHDFVLDIKVVPIDQTRCLCVLMTDFGSVLTETLHTETKISTLMAKRLEHYFGWRLTGQEMDEKLSDTDQKLAQKLYNELMIRYVTRYSSFSEEDLYQTGFARLLNYPEFNNASALASGLALFENRARMCALLRECDEAGDLKFWIGEGLAAYAKSASECAVIAIPYRVGKANVGAVALLGPTRLPYPKLFGLLRQFSDIVSDTLTRSLYKFKIQYRQPETGTLYLEEKEKRLLQSPHKQLEDKR